MKRNATFVISLPKFLFLRFLFPGNKKNDTQSNKVIGNKNKNENDVLFSNDTGILGKRNSEFSQQESNLRPSDY